MTGGLDGKLALVTGASRGYGRAIAERLASDGALVAVHYAENEAAAEATVASIRRTTDRRLRVRAPLDGSPASVDELFARLDEGLATLGRAPTVDILVNNAAISPRGTLEDTSEAVYDEVFAVDAKAPFFIIQRALPPHAGRRPHHQHLVADVADRVPRGRCLFDGEGRARPLDDRSPQSISLHATSQ